MNTLRLAVLLLMTIPILAQDAGITKSLKLVRSSNQGLMLPSASIGNWDHDVFGGLIFFKQDSIGVHRNFICQGNGIQPKFPGDPGPQFSFIMEIGPGNTAEFYTLRKTPAGYYDFNGKATSVQKLTDTTGFHALLFKHDRRLPGPDQIQMIFDGARLQTAYYKAPSGPAATVLHPFYLGGGHNAKLSFPGNVCSIAFFSGSLPEWSDCVTPDGKPKDLSGFPGLVFWERGDRTPLTTDEVLPTLWNNSNGVSQSNEVP